MSKNFIDKFYEEDLKKVRWTFSKKIGIALFILFLTVVMINTSGCSNKEESADVMIEDNSIMQPKEEVKVGNDGVNAAIAPDEDVTIVSRQDVPQEQMVTLSLEDTGRADPFLPSGEQKAQELAKKSKKLNFDLIVPPEIITVDQDASDVISTKVSGIMYDSLNPSAILNIVGSDYLVRTGDVINGYKVLSIQRDTVTVQLGANVYKAGVGQLFSDDGINYNTVSNLNAKFGGARNKVNKK